MKLLITGASGLLGINLAMEAMREHEVIGVDRGKLKSAPFQVIKADLLEGMRSIRLWMHLNPIGLSIVPRWQILNECEEHPDHARILNTEMPWRTGKCLCKERYSLCPSLHRCSL